MSTDFNERKELFLSKFFGVGNLLTRESLASSQTVVAANARHWTETLRSEQDICILPRKHNQTFYWYAIAFNDRSFRELRELIQAFVGPSYSDFRGIGHTLNPGDPVDAAVMQFAGSHTFRFQTSGSVEARSILAAVLETMWFALQDRDPRAPEDDRSTGRILRDFYMALTAGNRQAAEVCLNQMKSGSRLDTLNLKFLEIQVRAELDIWSEIIALPSFSSLLQVKRPPAVSYALIKAMYRTKLATFENADDPASALEYFATEILPSSGTLYRSDLYISDPDVVKSLMLATITTNSLNVSRLDKLLNTPGLDPTDRDYMRRLAAFAPTPMPVTAQPSAPIAAAESALQQMDWDTASAIASAAMPSIDRARILLHCALELSSNNAERAAVEAVAALSQSERDVLLQSRLYRELLTRLTGTEELTIGAVPGNWSEWLLQSCNPLWRRANETAANGAIEWSVSEYGSNPQVRSAFLASLERAAQDPTGVERLRDALPFIVRSFESDEAFPNPSLREVYDTLRMALVYYGPTGSLVEWQVFNELTEAVFGLGVNEESYSKMVEDALYRWETLGVPANFRGALDFLDMLVYFPCPEAMRQQFASAVLAKSIGWRQTSRIDEESTRYAIQLAADIGLSQLVPPEQVSSIGDGAGNANQDPLRSLAGLIAIYTLTETVANRACRTLRLRCPNCTVETNSDKVCTSQLEELAKSASIFVMVTASAKHAATECIETHRPTNMALLRPSGKGTSSILMELVKHATSASA